MMEKVVDSVKSSSEQAEIMNKLLQKSKLLTMSQYLSLALENSSEKDLSCRTDPTRL